MTVGSYMLTHYYDYDEQGRLLEVRATTASPPTPDQRTRPSRIEFSIAALTIKPVRVVVPGAPPLSTTRRPTVTAPGVAYARVAVALDHFARPRAAPRSTPAHELRLSATAEVQPHQRPAQPARDGRGE